MVNLDYMCLDNQSQYCLDVTEYLPELCNSQSLFEDTIGMNEKKTESYLQNYLWQNSIFSVNSTNS